MKFKAQFCMANPLDLKRRRYIALHSDGLSKTLCHPFRAFTKKKEKKKMTHSFSDALKYLTFI